MQKTLRHKEISLNFDKGFSKSEQNAIRAFNDSFDPDDFHLQLGEKGLVIRLRRVDIMRLREAARSFASKEDGQEIFPQVLQAVEEVKSYGISSGSRQYVGYNKERKVVNRKSKEAGRGPYFYANDHKFTKEINAVPEEYVDAIISGDSEEQLRRLPDNCVDIVFTSPPYNFGLDYSDNADAHSWQEYFDKLFAVLRQCVRVLKYGGRLVINIQPLYSDFIPSHHMVSNFLMSQKLIWKGEILWEKNNYNCKYTAWGSWKSPSNPYLKYTWEFIEVFCKGDLKKAGAREDIDISGDDFKKWTTAKWSVAPERNMKEFGHPAMFPEELVSRVLQLFSYQNDLVLDPFNGAGSTTVVAKRLNRRYLGIDISDQYCQMAERRLKEEINKLGLFSDGG